MWSQVQAHGEGLPVPPARGRQALAGAAAPRLSGLEHGGPDHLGAPEGARGRPASRLDVQPPLARGRSGPQPAHASPRQSWTAGAARRVPRVKRAASAVARRSRAARAHFAAASQASSGSNILTRFFAQFPGPGRYSRVEPPFRSWKRSPPANTNPLSPTMRIRRSLPAAIANAGLVLPAGALPATARNGSFDVRHVEPSKAVGIKRNDEDCLLGNGSLSDLVRTSKRRAAVPGGAPACSHPERGGPGWSRRGQTRIAAAVGT